MANPSWRSCTVKLPQEIYTEVEAGKDALAAWMHDAGTKKALMLDEDSDLEALQVVLARYGDSLTEDDMITIGQDPFLIAAAVGNADRCVVTAEVSKPTRTGARRHVPNVCDDCGVNWLSPVAFIVELDFSTDWDNPIA